MQDARVIGASLIEAAIMASRTRDLNTLRVVGFSSRASPVSAAIDLFESKTVPTGLLLERFPGSSLGENPPM